MNAIIKIILCTIVSATFANGQSLNWSTSDTSNSHMVYLNFGMEYGVVTQLGYGYKLKKDWPLWAQVDISRPMGGELFDDFKTRAGFQLKAFSYNNFALVTRIHAIYRVHSNELVGMKSWGSEASVAVGWYGSKWILELEGGFDKAIITQLVHADAYKENYANVKDNWYRPASGNWSYGFKAGRTVGKNLLLSLEIGATNAQGTDVNALIPAYLKIGALKPF